MIFFREPRGVLDLLIGLWLKNLAYAHLVTVHGMPRNRILKRLGNMIYDKIYHIAVIKNRYSVLIRDKLTPAIIRYCLFISRI